MGILSVVECYGERSASINLMYERTYARVFDVETSDPEMGPVSVRVAVDPVTGVLIPQPGSSYTNGLLDTDPLYEFDLGAFVNTIKVDPDGTATNWKVTVEYGPFNTAEFSGDPTLWRVRVQFNGEKQDRVIDFDRDGVPCRNSATDRFGDPITIDDHITLLTITRNEKISGTGAFDMNLASDYSDTINDAPWNGFDAGHCKMGIISSSEEKWDPNAQIWYYTITYPVQVSRKVWRKDILDQGFNELVGTGSTATPRPIMNGGQPISDPVMLDGTGHRAAITATPTVLVFEVYEETDWSLLGINLATRLGT